MRYFLLLILCVVGLSEVVTAGAHAEQNPPLTQNKNHYAKWKNGLPSDPGYFPIAVWLQQPKNAKRYQAAGINLYVGLWKGPTEEQLAELKEAGMPVICSQNNIGLAHKDDPVIVAWMHGDEPDNAQLIKSDPKTGAKTYGGPVPPPEIVEDYEKYRAKDPTRPIMLNLGQGVANDEWHGRGSGAHIDDYLTYVKGSDIVSFDVYPVVGIRKPDGENYLWYVPKGVSRLKKWSKGEKIIWNCIECTHISSEKKATPHQVRAEVWMSLIHGSMGLIYFVHEWKPKFNEHALLDDPEMLEAVTEINNQIHRLAPVLNSPTIKDMATVVSSSPEIPIALMAKKYENAAYIFAVGMRNAPTKGIFEVRGLSEVSKVEVMGEERNIQVENGKFEDDFGAYDVWIYRIQL